MRALENTYGQDASYIQLRLEGDLETQVLTLPAGHRFGVVQGEPASLED